MPWPERVFTRSYPVKDLTQRQPHESVEKAPIPPDYETVLQAVITALGDMKQPLESVRWELSGTRGVGVLVSDTMMLQRGEPTPSDPHLGSFYGLAMPLLKRGLPVEPVQIENATRPQFLQSYRVLLLTYEGQKPPTPEFHKALAQWVRAGGALVVVDNDQDPYNSVHDWWNTAPLAYQTPRQHLVETLGLERDATGLHRVGRGVVLGAALSPAALTYRADGADQVRTLVRQAAAVDVQWQESNTLVLRRGPYVVAAGLDESVPNAPTFMLRGSYVDLFDANLPLISQAALTPGRRMLLVDLGKFRRDMPRVVAAACRIRDEKRTRRELSFRADGIAATEAVVRIVSPRAPQRVEVDGRMLPRNTYDYAEGTLRIRFLNSPDGVPVKLRF